MARKAKPAIGALTIYVVKIAFTIPSSTRTFTRSWPVVARTQAAATKRAIAELQQREREQTTIVRTHVREHGPGDPGDDVTLEFGGRTFIYRQPGATASMLRAEED